MIEVTIQRPKDDVKEALVQFCARRGYRLSDPWYLEGLRIEIPDRLREKIQKRGFWATMTDAQTGPRIDVDVKRRRAKSSRVNINVGEHADSVRLAYELQAYLNDDRSYEAACPPICTSCGSNVPNPIARFCGRCGHQFSTGSDGGDRNVLRPPPFPAYAEPKARLEPTLDVVAGREPDSSKQRAAETATAATDAQEAIVIEEHRLRYDEADKADMPRESAGVNSPVVEEAVDEEDAMEFVSDEFEADSPETTSSPTVADDIARDEEGEHSTDAQREAEAIEVEDDEVASERRDGADNAARDDDDEPSGSEDDSGTTDEPRPTRRLLAEE